MIWLGVKGEIHCTAELGGGTRVVPPPVDENRAEINISDRLAVKFDQYAQGDQ